MAAFCVHSLSCRGSQARDAATPDAQALAAKLLQLHAENVEAAMHRPRNTASGPAASPPPHAIMASVMAERRHAALRCA